MSDMSTVNDQQLREFASLVLGPPMNNLKLEQAVVHSVQYGSLTVYLSGAPFAVGGIRYLDTYDNPQVGDVIWLLRNGGDHIALGPLRDYVSTLDSWHVVGQPFEPAYGTNWVSFGSGWEPAGFRKDPDGWVTLRGLVDHTGTGVGTTIFTLPVGYRPAILHQQLIMAGGGWAVITINPDGTIVLSSGDASVFASLFGVRFLSGESPEDWSRVFQMPVLLDGKSKQYSPSIDRAPGFYFREDGMCFGQGAIMILDNTGSQALLPERMGTLRSDIYGTFCFKGIISFSRTDLEGSSRNVYLRNVGAGTPIMDLGGIGFPAGYLERSFTELIPGNSWVNYGEQYSHLSWYKDKYGVVHLRGLIKSGTMTAGTVIATLPFGARPAYRCMIFVYANDVIQRLDIETNGEITIPITWTQNAYVSLSNCFFWTT